jgi:ankyrin repeat protein
MSKRVSLGRTAALFASGFYLLALALPNARAIPQTPKDTPQVVKRDGYHVSVPPGKNWKIEPASDVNGVSFSKYKEGLLTQLAGQARGTLITVTPIELGPGDWWMSETEAAEFLLAGFVKEETRRLDEPGEVAQQCRVEIAGKDVRFAILFFRSPDSRARAELVFYIYAVPEFRKFHRAFLFTYYFTSSHEAPRLYKGPDLDPVHAVIGSLQIDDPITAPATAEGGLVRAAARGDLSAVRETIEQGVSPDARSNGWTALSAASFFGHRGVLDLLLEAGADMNRPDEDGGLTPLHRALKGGEAGIAAALLERGAAVGPPDKKGLTPLMCAAALRDPAVASAILEKGAPVDARNENGETALMIAAQNGAMEIAPLLKARGAEVNAQAKSGWTALMRAVARRQADMAGWLVDNGADVALCGTTGWTALMAAVDSEDIETARWLIESGADVNARTETGATALMFASEYGLEEMVKLLLEKGADVNARADKKLTALKLAKHRKNPEIIKMLKAAGAK